MAIIRSGTNTNIIKSLSPELKELLGRAQDEEDEVPFVPAYDLLADSENKLTDYEIAAVAAALFLLVPAETELSAWQLAARTDGVSQRL